MRVVLDTNIVVSGILSSRGAPRALLDLARAGRIDIVTSPLLLDELEEVLARFFQSSAAAEIRAAIEDIAHSVQPTSIPSVSRDPDDDHVLAAAVAGDAISIVSRDQDLLSIEEYQGIQILDPAQALHAIREQLDSDKGIGTSGPEC